MLTDTSASTENFFFFSSLKSMTNAFFRSKSQFESSQYF